MEPDVIPCQSSVKDETYEATLKVLRSTDSVKELQTMMRNK